MKLNSTTQTFATESPLFRVFSNPRLFQFQRNSIKPAEPYCFSVQSKILMSNPHSFCLSSAKVSRSHLHLHLHLHPPSWAVVEAPKVSSLLQKPTNLCFVRPITFQRIPIKQPIYSSSSSSASPSATLQPIEELPPKLQEIVRLFQAVEEPKAKYEQLLFYGRKLKPLDAHYKTSDNKVQGCVSQVWVRAYFDNDKNVIFEADSDSVLTKGLAALLVQGLSGRPVEEIVKVSPDFVVLLGLQQSLTPSRNNGFLNMLKLMQKKALQLYVEAEKAGNLGNESSESPSDNSKSGLKREGEDGDVNSEGDDRGGAVVSKFDSGNGGVLGSRGLRMKEKLESELKPIELEVEDISYQHAGHAGVRGSDGETHFNVKVVSEEFEGKSLVKRHRLIYGVLQDELQNGLHALSIVAKTPSEISSS